MEPLVQVHFGDGDAAPVCGVREDFAFAGSFSLRQVADPPLLFLTPFTASPEFGDARQPMSLPPA